MFPEWEMLRARLQTGGLRRRDFIASAAALGLSGVLVETALAQAPTRGGHLILGISGASSSDSLDPATWKSEFMHNVGPQLSDSLVVLDEHVALNPSLAESWEAKPGAKEWIFKLRRGVTFHNGKELTASDVIYTVNHHIAPGTKSSMKAVLSTIAEVKATDKYEVSFFLRSANADLPYFLSDIHAGIFPEESKFNDGIGTGAFVLESFEPGVRVRVKRNTNDWRTDRGYVDSLETIAVNDPTARISGLASGSLHVIDKVPPSAVAQLKTSAGLQVFNATSTAHALFAVLCDTAPYDNLDLRLALKYAIDREAILKTVQRGFGDVGNDQPIPRFIPFYSADIPQRRYDPERAKFHYQKSGHEGPVVLTAAEANFTGAVDAAQIFRQSAAKAGIDLQVNRVPSDGYYDTVWMKNPFCSSFWGGYPTADAMLTVGYLSSAPWNETHWRREKFDQLLITARGELDAGKRKQMYHDLQFMIHEDGGAIIYLFADNVDAAAKNVRGFLPKPVKEMSGFRAAEGLWFAA